MQFESSGCHVEIGKGISNTKVESIQAKNAIMFVMDKAESLHVHDNSFITTVIPEHILSIDDKKLGWRHLKQFHVARCPKMNTVFTTNYFTICPFEELKTFSAKDELHLEQRKDSR